MKKNNKTFNTIWSDGDFDRSRDDEYHISHHIALTTWSATEKSSYEDPEDVPAHDSVSSDGEVLTNEAIIESYRTMYQKWLQVVKINERLRKEHAQLNIKKNDQLKRIMLLEGDLAKRKKIQGELSGELEHMKKQVRMRKSGSSKLDQILASGKATRDHVGLGYKGEASSSKTLFVPASKLKKPEVIKKKTDTRSKTRSGTTGKRWVPMCHYCNRVGHIRP